MTKNTINMVKKPKFFINISAMLLLVVSAFSGVLLLTTDAQVSAATATMYFSPSVKTVQKGNTFTVQVRFNPGGVAVNTAAFTANFDSSKLSLVSKSLSGGAMSTAVVDGSTSSSVTFEGAKLGGSISSDSLLETLTFKAVGGSGTATISLSDARSNRVDNNAEVSVARGAATITLTTPTIPKPLTEAPPKQDTTTAPTTDTKKDTKKGDTKKSTTTASAPKLVNQKVTAEFSQAKLTVTSDVSTTAYVLFGTSSPTEKSAVSALARSHSITLAGAKVLPGTTYNYVIVLTDSKGHVTKSAQMTMTTKGLPVHIQVLDGAGQPLHEKDVTLHSTPQTTKTDKDGFASFAVAPGNHTLEYTANGKTYASKLVVANNTTTVKGVQTAATQDFSVVFPVAQNNYQLYILIALITFVAVLLVLIALILRKRQQVITPVNGSWGSESPPDSQQSSEASTNALDSIESESATGGNGDLPDTTQPPDSGSYYDHN